jgi:hypothetical protein
MSLIEPPSFISLAKALPSGFDSTTVIYIICIALLLFVSALMSGSESAFFSLRPSDKEDLKKENTSRSKLILNLLGKPKELLATILITNNFVNVGIVILSTFILNDVYPPMPGTELKRFLLEVVGITFLILLLGEVVPKIFAARNTMSVVRWMSYPLYFLGSISRYRPAEFDQHMSGEYGPFLSEFLASEPSQMLFELASLLSGRELVSAGLA